MTELRPPLPDRWHWLESQYRWHMKRFIECAPTSRASVRWHNNQLQWYAWEMISIDVGLFCARFG